MSTVIGMPRMGNDLFRRYMKSKYVRSLKRAGAQVRWIPLEDSEEARRLLLSCDGLLMPGGVDIEPARYGQETDPQCGKIDRIRDEAEWRILTAFLPTRRPVFCICRGCQLLNVYFGGTLHQHISGHSDFSSRGKGFHNVRVDEKSRLYALTNSQNLFVNSLHHQAADRIGTGLLAAAVSDDGVTEAVELQDHPFCLGVQWHPEHLSRKNPLQQKLFDAFVEACK